MKQSYSPGIYPVEYIGSATGKPFYASTTNKDFWTKKGNIWRCNYEGTPNFGNQGWWDSHCTYIDLSPNHFVSLGGDVRSIWKFGGAKEGEHQAIGTDAVVDVRSPDGQVTTAKAAFNFVPGGEGITEVIFAITPSPCVRPISSIPIIPVIKRWAVRNPVVQDGEAPRFEFEVTNPHIISIRHGDEYISCVTINPFRQQTLESEDPSFLRSLSSEVHASTTNDKEFKQPYSPGIYPAGFNGGTNGKPSKVAWKFGEKSMEDSAEITVCSPSGDVAMATVRFVVTARSAAGTGMDAIMVGPGARPPVINFTASRNIVAPMDPVIFTWNVTGDNLTVKLVSDGNQRTVPPSGSENIIIMKSACYYITAENPAGRASQQQCITVQTSGFIPPPVFIEPPCPPETAPPLWAPPSTPPTTTPPVAPLTDGY
jgi:hypothetical protein